MAILQDLSWTTLCWLWNVDCDLVYSCHFPNRTYNEWRRGSNRPSCQFHERLRAVSFLRIPSSISSDYLRPIQSLQAVSMHYRASQWECVQAVPPSVCPGEQLVLNNSGKDNARVKMDSYSGGSKCTTRLLFLTSTFGRLLELSLK